jgi:hypothetical protein
LAKSAATGLPVNQFATPYPCGRAPNTALSHGLMPTIGFAFEIDRKYPAVNSWS